jgi:superfamily II DNA or RNA helicase
MITSLSSRGYGIVKDTLTPQELNKLKESLTVTPHTINSTDVTPTIILYREGPKKIYIPKYYGLEKFGKPGVSNFDHITRINTPFNGILREEQLAPVKAYIDAAKNELCMGGVINLSCGAGKTVISLNIISTLSVKTMIVVHKEFLIEQWKTRIAEFLPTASIGLIKAKVIDVADKDIVIASLQSLSMKQYDRNIFDGIGFVIVDEVHRTATEVFSQALGKVQFRYTLGLSATIVRKDGMGKIFEWYLGKVVFKKKQTAGNVIVQYKAFSDKSPQYGREETLYSGKPNIARMINTLASYEPRNKYIANLINKAVMDEDRNILVLSDRKSQLKDIATLLDISIPYGFYMGKMSPVELAHSEKQKVILATYSFASEGFDVKSLDTLVFATPKTDIEQSVGRILRQKEEQRTKTPLIIDIVDLFSVFERQSKKRLTLYKKWHYVVQKDGANASSDDDTDKCELSFLDEM